MPEIEQTEFVFPDETDEKPSRVGSKVVEPEPEIEIVDDTPEVDRNRAPMATPPVEPSDEELEAYTSKQQKQKVRECQKCMYLDWSY